MTVLFADIVGFTEFSESVSAEALVAVLNDIFTRFDRIADSRGLEKIKTIGDAYMVAAGLPDPVADHTSRAAHMALDMMEEIDGFNVHGSYNLKVRIGISTGPGIAGAPASANRSTSGGRGDNRQPDGITAWPANSGHGLDSAAVVNRLLEKQPSTSRVRRDAHLVPEQQEWLEQFDTMVSSTFLTPVSWSTIRKPMSFCSSGCCAAPATRPSRPR